MAIRRHLVLAPSQEEDALGRALEGIDTTPPAQAGPWCWAAASAWSESHEAIRSRLAGTTLPFLLFSTFDGDGWRLAASTGTGAPLEATHEFATHWRDGARESRKSVRRLAEILHSVARGSNPTDLEEVLSGRALTEAERESDLGDLPRLLKALGAEGIAEIPEAEPPRRERAPKPTRFQSLLKGHGGRARSRVEGVSLAVADGGDLAALALFCDPDILIAMEARGVGLPAIKLDIPCKVCPGAGLVVVEADGGMGLKLNVISRSLAELAGSAGLAELTLVTGKPRGGGRDVAWHRYTGIVKGGRWHLSEATPAVDGTTLAAALALIADRRAAGAIACRSDEEATSVARRCEGGLYITPDRQPRRRGAELHPAEGTRLYVLMELFRLRFAETWDSTAARRAEEREAGRWDALGREGGGR